MEPRQPRMGEPVAKQICQSFDPLGRSSTQTCHGVAEWAEGQITWPGQRSILYPVLKLYYFNVPEEYPGGTVA